MMMMMMFFLFRRFFPTVVSTRMKNEFYIHFPFQGQLDPIKKSAFQTTIEP